VNELLLYIGQSFLAHGMLSSSKLDGRACKMLLHLYVLWIKY